MTRKHKSKDAEYLRKIKDGGVQTADSGGTPKPPPTPPVPDDGG